MKESIKELATEQKHKLLDVLEKNNISRSSFQAYCKIQAALLIKDAPKNIDEARRQVDFIEDLAELEDELVGSSSRFTKQCLVEAYLAFHFLEMCGLYASENDSFDLRFFSEACIHMGKAIYMVSPQSAEEAETESSVNDVMRSLMSRLSANALDVRHAENRERKAAAKAYYLDNINSFKTKSKAAEAVAAHVAVEFMTAFGWISEWRREGKSGTKK